MTTKVTPIQFLRSIVSRKRPDPAKLLSGQAAVNTNPDEPGLFFANSNSNELVKIGPVAVGIEPNAGTSLSKGEMWMDTTTSPTLPVLKVWDGTQWLTAMPFTFARPIISDTDPSLGLYPDGTMWWNSTNGLLYLLYNDGTTTQWVQISSAAVP
jgi:hypothetical protein